MFARFFTRGFGAATGGALGGEGAAHGEGEANQTECAICYADVTDKKKHPLMPCCGREGSSITFCISCLGVLCERGDQEGVGRCPSCRTSFKLIPSEDGSGLLCPKAAVDHRPKCRVCQQYRPIEYDGCCGQCVFGYRL